MARRRRTPNGRLGGELRVRMYRIGFGDFFLVTVPSADGPQHVLIDCGVTTGRTGKGDIHTIKAAVAQMAAETNGRLALLIATHRHMDHIIGFSRCEDIFKTFKVDAIWMPIWETEYAPEVMKFQADLNALALDLQQYLAAAGASADPRVMSIAGILENATGVSPAAGPGGGTNAKSLALLKTQMGVKPQYLSRGDKPALPSGLVKAGVEAAILGPPPVDALAFMRLTDLKKGVGQYLDAADDGEGGAQFAPFGPDWAATPSAYPMSAFREWAPPRSGGARDVTKRYSKRVEEVIAAAQPAALLTAAKQLDDFLNNQSLVVLFTWNGRKLLFAGDAQAGNWEYWLYDLDKPSKTTTGETLTAEGASILSGLDFYKVGHHGSTNATPIAAVTAMGTGFAAMCSTQADTFGSQANASEVPRGPLLDALGRKCALVRSDQIAVTLPGQAVAAAAGAPHAVPAPLRGRFEVGSCYVDYLLP
jgi:beta-lactamase superfamily II metal-dependent hydrolase